MKTCSRCQESKEFNEFYDSKTTKDGKFAWCKTCKSAHRKLKYQNNKEQEYEKHRQWVENNQEKRSAQNVKATQAWAERNRTKVRQTKRKYKLKRSEWELQGSFTQKEWDQLLETYDHKCLSCKKDDVLLTQDHVVPLSKGGPNTIDNIQPLCGPCNSRKGTKTIDYRIQ